MANMALSNAFQSILGGLVGGTEGYARKREELVAAKERQSQLEERQRQIAAQDAATKRQIDAAELANSLAGVRQYAAGETLGKGERVIGLPSGQQRVIGRAPGKILEDQQDDEETSNFIKSAVASGTIGSGVAETIGNAPRDMRREMLKTLMVKPKAPDYSLKEGGDGFYHSIDPATGRDIKTNVRIPTIKSETNRAPTPEELAEATAAWNTPEMRAVMEVSVNGAIASGDKTPLPMLRLGAYRVAKARSGILESVGGVKKPAVDFMSQFLGQNTPQGNPAEAGTPGSALPPQRTQPTAAPAPASAPPTTPPPVPRPTQQPTQQTRPKPAVQPQKSEEETMHIWKAVNPATGYPSKEAYLSAFYRDHPEFRK